MSNEKKDSRFVNPYQFIALPEKKAKAYSESGNLTGVIEYELKTRTPLFIPNSSSETAFKESERNQEHKSYDFFSYHELDPFKTYEHQYHEPVIPGSEMRGVLRSVYETLTDSCMGVLNESLHAVKRVGTVFHPGLLRQSYIEGQFELVEAESMRIGNDFKKDKAEFSGFKNGQKIYFQKKTTKPVTAYDVNSSKWNHYGYLLLWGKGVRKKRYHLYAPKNNETTIATFSKDDVLQHLENVVQSYLEQPAITAENQKAYQQYLTDLKAFLKDENMDCFPVNYLKRGEDLIYLSPALITKERSVHSIGELAGEFAPCKEEICPACDLFGFLTSDQEGSRSSKIRVADLRVKERKNDPKDYYMMDKITLENLNGPKIANTEFYLKKPEGAEFWSYDYYVNQKKTHQKKQGKQGIQQQGILRGRKFYWHNPNCFFPKNVEATKLNKTIRPVKRGIVFKGKLYFEKISQRQLDQLIWILNSGKEELALKIGGGKPLGLGSVTCEVTKVLKRQIKLENDVLKYEVQTMPDTDVTYEKAQLSKNVEAEFRKIAGLNTVKGMDVIYPRRNKASSEEKGFEWFGDNHNANSFGKLKINYALPELMSQDITLPCDSTNHKGNRNSKKNR